MLATLSGLLFGLIRPAPQSGAWPLPSCVMSTAVRRRRISAHGVVKLDAFFDFARAPGASWRDATRSCRTAAGQGRSRLQARGAGGISVEACAAAAYRYFRGTHRSASADADPVRGISEDLRRGHRLAEQARAAHRHGPGH